MADEQDTEQVADTEQAEDTDRPMPGPGHATPEGVGDGGAVLDDPTASQDEVSPAEAEASEATSGQADPTDESSPDQEADEGDGERPPPPDSEPEYNDRDKMDFDPDAGLYTGTAVEGGTSIPGPHVEVDDVDPEADDAGDADKADGDD